VYLGLVLVGATPQVLAQAAMTRQFNVKDEVEFKEDLDENPASPTTDRDENAVAPSEAFVSASIDNFLSNVAPTCAVSTLTCTAEHHPFRQLSIKHIFESQSSARPSPEDLVTVTNLPRAGLDTLLAIDAK